MDELLARIRAAMRHQLQVHGERPIFRAGGLTVDLVRRVVKVSDKTSSCLPRSTNYFDTLSSMQAKFSLTNICSRALWDDLRPTPSILRVYVRHSDKRSK